MSLKMFHVLVSSLLFTGKHLAPCLMSFPSGVLNSQLAKKTKNMVPLEQHG